MDYSDNDNEGNDFHLTGEESSKHSSAARSFVHPKFDFDGNLRFDSLVDNEVLLGIPNQDDDNQWIEEYSRGTSGLRFGSSATVSCTLPRCNNVWSEATSSESVEMLLKAVGQEETIPDESMVNEMDPVNQVESMEQLETNLRQDDEVNDVDDVNPLLPTVEVEPKISMPDQSILEEKNLSCSEVKADGKDSSSTMISDTIETSEDKGESHNRLNDSSNKQMQRILSLSSTGIDNIRNSYHENAAMLGNQDKTSDVFFTSSTCTPKDIAERVDEHKENTVQTFNSEIQHSLFPSVTESSNEVHASDSQVENFGSTTEGVDELKDDSVQTVNSEIRHSLFPPVTESLNEVHALEVQVDTSRMSRREDSISEVENRGEVALDVEPSIDSDCGSAIKQMYECYSMSVSHGMSSVSFQGEEYKDGLDAKGSDDATNVCVDIESKQDSVTQLSDRPLIHSGIKDVFPDSISIETPLVTIESSSPAEQDIRNNTDDANGPEKSGIECMREAIHSTMQNESLDDGCHNQSLVTDVNKLPCSEADADLYSPALAQEHVVSLTVCEKDDKNLPLGVNNEVSDDHGKEAGVAEVNDKGTTGSQPSTPVGNYHGEVLSDCGEKTPPPPPFESEYIDQKEDFEAAKQPNYVQSLEVVAKVASVTGLEINKALGYVAAETKSDTSSVSLVKIYSAAMHGEAAVQELCDKVEHSNLILQNDGSEVAHTERAVESNVERSSGIKDSARSSEAEIIESNRLSASSTNVSGLPQVEVNKKGSPEMDVENVNEDMPTPTISGLNSLAKQEETFTFDVRPLGDHSTEDLNKSVEQISTIQMSLIGEGCPSSSGQNNVGMVNGISQPSSLDPSCEPSLSEDVKGSADRKPRRRSSKSGMESTKKANLAKETTPLQQGERLDKSPTFSSGQIMTFDGVVKSVGGVSVSSTFSLPDLSNASGPSSALFRQPFTDLQQVQLRAQILVYGSLIKGTAPDEAFMVSAFDGVRSLWEPSWRACIERRHGKKNDANKAETETPSKLGATATTSDQSTIHGSSETKGLLTPVGRASDKAAPSPLSPFVNPIIPLSSPLWNINTPSCGVRFDYRAVSPLHPYPTIPTQNWTAQTTTLPSQDPFPVPWLASSKNSPFDIRANFSVSPITEPVKLTPLKEIPHVPAIHTTATTVSTLDLKTLTGSTSNTETKTRKRKKSTVTTALPIHVTASQVDTVSTPLVTSHLTANFPASPVMEPVKLTPIHELPNVPAIHTVTTTVFTGTPLDLQKGTGSASKTETKTRKRKKASVTAALPIHVTASQVDSVSTPLVTSHMPKIIPEIKKLSEISFAKNQTESESVFSLYSTPVTFPTASFLPKIVSNQIFTSSVHTVSTDMQRTALRFDKRALDMESFRKVEEAKLQAEQAAAIATEAVNQCQGVWSKLDQQKNSGLSIDAETKLASASVAIAAAACVAKAAAAAAKIAFNAAVQAKQMADEATSMHGTMSTNSLYDFGSTTPVSTLAISAAREAARERVEAASAASRHAENLDAIVKAAELAAEAVSHTGKIVGIGDPFSLNELLQAGPDDYWKVSHLTSAPGSVPDDTNLHEQPDKDVHDTGHVAAIQTDVSENFGNDNFISEENLASSVKSGANILKPRDDNIVLDGKEVISAISESGIELRSSSSVLYDINASIKEGSIVEVLKDVGVVKKAWFEGTVSSLLDVKALVSYTELQGEGSEALKEWVSLDAQGDKAPLVRIARPLNAIQFGGTRKRRRSAVKDYAWSVGDSVDAWVKDCWREGIIAEKNNKDPATMTVSFPADGEIQNVKMWHLRPSLVWGDGQWSEHCKAGHSGTSQGDTPKEKRPKLGNAGVQSEDKMTTKTGFAKQAKQGTTDEEKLPLSANEVTFNIGIRDENKVRTMRSGLQKEGPRVIFGVPTPKRKYMEVSKHYDSQRPTKTQSNDLAKSAKNATHLGFGSRGSKNNSKPDLKEKHVPEHKPRTVKSRKPPIPTRTTLQQKGDTISSRPNTSDVTSSNRLGKCSSMSNDDNDSEQKNVSESGSFSDAEETSRGTFVFSSKALSTEKRKKAESRNVQSGRLNKGKVPISSGKLAKTVSQEQLTSEASEPRRSNRRIQPTSRLLEGIQSSLTISKLPSSHDKGLRSHWGHQKGNDNRG